MPMLFENQGSDGVSSIIRWKGGTGTFTVWGEFGDGTVSLEIIPDRGTTGVPLSSATSMTVPGTGAFTLRSGTQIRSRLAGAAGSPSPIVSASVD